MWFFEMRPRTPDLIHQPPEKLEIGMLLLAVLVDHVRHEALRKACEKPDEQWQQR